VLTHHSTVRVPGHTARDIDKKHSFEVVGAVGDAFGELVEGRATCVVDYVGDLGGVFVRFDLAVTFMQEVVSDNSWKACQLWAIRNAALSLGCGRATYFGTRLLDYGIER
jgi:hypothetical protein